MRWEPQPNWAEEGEGVVRNVDDAGVVAVVVGMAWVAALAPLLLRRIPQTRTNTQRISHPVTPQLLLQSKRIPVTWFRM